MDHLVLQRQLKLADFALFLLILHGTAALPLATTQDCPAASGSWTFRPRDPASAGSRGPASTTRHSSSSHVFLAVEEGKIGEKWLDYAERIGGAVHEEGELALPARFGDAAEVALCRGRLVGGQRALVAVKRDPRLEFVKPIFFLTEGLPPRKREAENGMLTFVLQYSCRGDYNPQRCIKITAKDGQISLSHFSPEPKAVRRRSLDDISPKRNHPESSSFSSTLIAMVTVCVAVLMGVAGFATVMFLCGSHSSFEPSQKETVRTVDTVRGSHGTVMANDTHSAEGNGRVTQGATPQVETQVESVDFAEPTEAGELPLASMAGEPPKDSPPQSPGGPPSWENASPEEEELVLSKRFSSRIQEPLPSMPTPEVRIEFEVSAQPAHTALLEVPEGGEEGGGYAYARVQADQDMNESDSEEETGDEGAGIGADGTNTRLPPYGKVTRHQPSITVPPTEEVDGESYAEVREFDRVPKFRQGRFRSATEPVDPAHAVEMRDRSQTAESATLLPLPAIPSLKTSDEMYDSIPDGTIVHTAALPEPVMSKRPKERLYESVDELDNLEDGPEDTYEVVPDEIKSSLEVASDYPLSPPILSSRPTLVPPPSPRLPPTSPLPPASPVPRNHHRSESEKDKKEEKDDKHKKKKGDKKELSKTVSDSDRKRTFSAIFGRKKPSSSTVGKAKEKEPSHTHGPLPDIPTGVLASPHQLSPPPPTLALGELVSDDGYLMYDTADVQVPPLGDSPSKVAEAKTKSRSLPSTGRTASASVFTHPPNLPLPDLPDDSGSGIIVHLQPDLVDVDEIEPDYDIVVHGEREQEEEEGGEDEPKYDVVNREELLGVVAEADPGYDKVGIMVGQEVEPVGVGPEDEDREEGASPRDMGYGKVTKPAGAAEAMNGEQPAHDELGYAVIPAEVKIRKRTMSATVQRPARQVGQQDVDHNYDQLDQLALSAGDSVDDQAQELSPVGSHTPSPPPQMPGFMDEDEDPYSSIDARVSSPTVEDLMQTLPPSDEYDPYSKIDTQTGAVPDTSSSPVISSPPSDDYDPYSMISGGTEPSVDVPESSASVNSVVGSSGSCLTTGTGAAADSSAQEEEDKYSTVNLSAKRLSQKQKQPPLGGGRSGGDSSIAVTSPTPPPLPPAYDLGDLGELVEPPVPPQTAGVHELVPAREEPKYSSVVKRPKVKPTDASAPSDNHPGGVATTPPLDMQEEDSRAGYDTVQVKKNSETRLKDKVLGYDTIDEDAVRVLEATTHVTGAQSVGTSASDEVALSDVHVVQPMYDSLEPVDTDTYDSLAPTTVDSENEDGDQQYEEIDERRRVTLLTKYQQHTLL